MNLLFNLSILAIGLVTMATCQAPNDPWYNGLNSDTDDVSVNCQVASGHSDCLNQHSDVIAAVDKTTRCPALAVFVACIKSECSNSNSFQSTFNALDTYCNSGKKVISGMTLVFIMAVLAALSIHS
ncbi:hypothetical protein RRG08_007197 [Elysia crispata]|uniref:Extracellular membrane protein CFEM domain-containing protein n=1 Tax=Elysia crispata TaxID=231223 RepID=A0AAE1E9W0_9GAST|nr:hypothetical protein RRG08_007197 [Elysia crispata]